MLSFLITFGDKAINSKRLTARYNLYYILRRKRNHIVIVLRGKQTKTLSDNNKISPIPLRDIRLIG